MGERWVGVLMLIAAGCRITAVEPPPKQCDPFFCGGQVAVKTSLSPRTALTAAECKSLCAPFWCDHTPIANPPGCELLSPGSVHCSAVVYDCGYDFGGARCGPQTCSGCCQPDGTCTSGFGQCGGSSCAECVGCTATGCAALAGCGGHLEAEPRLSTCADAGGGVDPSLDLSAWCPAACFESGAVATVQCAQRLGTSCADGGLLTGCFPDAGPALPCAADCATARDGCEQACPQTSYSGCMTCSASCGITFARCVKSCPP